MFEREAAEETKETHGVPHQSFAMFAANSDLLPGTGTTWTASGKEVFAFPFGDIVDISRTRL